MPDTAAPKPDPGPVYEAKGWRAPLLWLASLVVRFWCRTLRVDCDLAALHAHRADPAPVTMMMWHNRLFMVPWLARVAWPGRPVYGLVSASRDGANLARFFDYVGMRVVRGSSSRFGREALRELIAVQRAGHDIAITPDGPRGPLYQLKAGALIAARRTRAPILLLGVDYQNAWRLRSWDRFCIPKPFSRVVIRQALIATQSVPAGRQGLESLRCRLLELSGESPAAWPASSEPEDDEGAVA
ncbi:MAG: lysophospholipid acyltransferase family protein [Opitutaceae bacterium]|nr:lysophospholipid acyltransferase family protein [Opitutaceae bacterium]